MRLQEGHTAVLVKRHLLDVKTGAIDVCGKNANALALDVLGTDAEKDDALANIVDLEPAGNASITSPVYDFGDLQYIGLGGKTGDEIFELVRSGVREEYTENGITKFRLKR
jgi:hypothetical protein